MKLQLATFALTLSLAFTPAVAQDSVRLQLAREYIATIKVKEMLHQQTDLMLGPLAELVLSKEVNISEPVKDELAKRLKEKFTAEIPIIFDDLAEMFAKEFTVEELQQMNDFNKSPLGIRLIEAQPQMIEKMSKNGALRGAEIGYAIISEMRAEGKLKKP
jgi:hypothetical protein